MSYVCYALHHPATGRTYVGCTNNFTHRLRQHNGELAGGARYTSSALPRGRWQLVATARGFEGHREALSFEWHWKHVSRRLAGGGLHRRLVAAQQLCERDRFRGRILVDVVGRVSSKVATAR